MFLDIPSLCLSVCVERAQRADGEFSFSGVANCPVMTAGLHRFGQLGITSHLLDIDPGPRVEWDFNPPETCAARHTVRAVKTEELKEVQKYL